jgi:hypothetical protein
LAEVANFKAGFELAFELAFEAEVDSALAGTFDALPRVSQRNNPTTPSLYFCFGAIKVRTICIFLFSCRSTRLRFFATRSSVLRTRAFGYWCLLFEGNFLSPKAQAQIETNGASRYLVDEEHIEFVEVAGRLSSSHSWMLVIPQNDYTTWQRAVSW